MKWQFSLDTIVLDRFEVPEEFTFGHESKSVIHDYPSETGTPIRVVHAMGAFSLPNSWKGVLFGANALNRALQLDRLCTQEREITFRWGPFSQLVHIKKFEATPKYQSEIHYTIELDVIRDLNGTVSAADTARSFDVGTQSFFDQSQQAVSDMQAADPALPANITTDTNSVFTQFLGAVPLKSASYGTLTSLINAINLAISDINTYATPLQNSAVLAADLAKLDACLRALQGFGLLNSNLMQLTGALSANAQTITTSDSLFEIASQYYPNSDTATAADLIANANGLSDYFLDAPTTLVLPPVFS